LPLKATPTQSASRYSVCGVVALPGYRASARTSSNRWASDLDPRTIDVTGVKTP